MLSCLDKRLRKLESALLAELDTDKEFDRYFQIFLLDAFGYYFGDPKPGETIEAATARERGHEQECQFNEGTECEKYGRAN